MPVKAFQQLTTKHLECRNLNHSWIHKDTEVISRYGWLRLWFRCSRCLTERIDTRIRKTGELESRRYIYANSYLVEELKSWGGRKQFNRNVSIELMERYVKQKKGG